MSEAIFFTTPVGRFVQGSLYVPQTKDIDGNDKVYKSGKLAGEPRSDYFFALALPKGTEKHWNQTEWGKIIWETGQKAFPSGAANSPSFAWKIKDGDSQIPNKKGKKPCDIEGFPGHWIMNLTSTFAPTIYNENGSVVWPEVDRVKPGSYIQVNMSVAGNKSIQQPGIYLNHRMVSFQAFGPLIKFGTDPKAVGFGSAALPAGASRTPVSGGFNPQPVEDDVLPEDFGSTSKGAPPPPPYPSVLTPSVSKTPKPTAKLLAAGQTYEGMIKAGWTDELLFRDGYIEG